MKVVDAPRTHYNQIAGHSLDRVTGLSDGIFAFAMTLLVLGLAIPAAIMLTSVRRSIRSLLSNFTWPSGFQYIRFRQTCLFLVLDDVTRGLR